MQYRRAKKITSIITKYIFRTRKGCIKNADNLLNSNHASLSLRQSSSPINVALMATWHYVHLFGEQDDSLITTFLWL